MRLRRKRQAPDQRAPGRRAHWQTRSGTTRSQGIPHPSGPGTSRKSIGTSLSKLMEQQGLRPNKSTNAWVPFVAGLDRTVRIDVGARAGRVVAGEVGPVR